MQVILLERIAKLGQMGDIVSVKDGYARNFLLPQKKALWASEANIKQFEEQKVQLEARNIETRKEADALAGKFDGRQFIVIRQASDGGSLYGSVTTRDVVDVASEAGFALDKRQVAIEAPIKELGVHSVAVKLHPEVEVQVQLNVARSEDEAELQAKGINIAEQSAEDEAKAELEIAELFDEIGAAELDELQKVGDPEDEEMAGAVAVEDTETDPRAASDSPVDDAAGSEQVAGPGAGNDERREAGS
ncbi:MAG: 50S ribosomal protein L9 [Boseongicola sp. SB0664_bin_43]|uniref:Large ribosomal subunit protein bL9 n=1 Tax=Boseongicola sp. SB0664_bin_43 TaxID=2604844 RepID=A0A6B0Y1M8_9RHOB|nr:50S ribosomal protein L9 [Boseongicola sp. SB0664_bin_43]